MRINNKDQYKLFIVDVSDKIIKQYSKNNVCTEYRDINLNFRKDGMIKPYSKSIYDPKYFGSIFLDQCNCGRKRVVDERCTYCGSTRYDEISALQKYARIEIPFYILHEIKIKAFLKLFDELFPNRITNFYTTVIDSGNMLEVIEMSQFDYDPEQELLIATDNITDLNKTSYEGLLTILSNHKRDKVERFLDLVNRYLIVVPPAVRPLKIKVINDVRSIHVHEISECYQTLIYAIQEYYPQVIQEAGDNLIELNLIRAVYRSFVRSVWKNISGVLRSSKENLTRQMQSFRLTNSGRNVIIPDPDLKIDEVSLPRSLVYEACGEEFIKYITEVTNNDERGAKKLYLNNATSREVQKLFNKYIEGDESVGRRPKHVIINRAPTLYEGNLMSCRIILNNGYHMGLPLALCAPFNADFDGDTMSWHIVPEDQYDYINEQINPRNIVYYRKSLTPMFTPKHEVLYGLIIASRIDVNSNPIYFTNLEDAKKIKESDPKFRYQSRIILGGVETTLGRAIISELVGTDIEKVIGNNQPIDKNNILLLYSKLEALPDRVDRLKKLEDFAVDIVTLSGSTTTSLKDMMVDVDPKYHKTIEDIDKSPILTEKEKYVRYNEVYSEYSQKHLEKFDNEVKLNIQSQSRASINNLIKGTFPMMIPTLDKDLIMTKRSLVEGLSPDEYIEASVSSRGIAEVKSIQLPSSGNTTRLLSYASNFVFEEGEDIDNPGILIEARDAKGRTKIDGTIVEETNSSEKIRVRSVITSTIEDGIITKDMISNYMNYRPGQSIGKLMTTAWGECSTQAALKLKHDGVLYYIDDSSKLHAPYKCKIIITDTMINFVNDKDKVLGYIPKPNDFVQNHTPNGWYSKNEVIGYVMNQVTPSYKLNQIIHLISSRFLSTRKSFGKNKLTIGICYALENGEITYGYENNNVVVRIGNTVYPYNPNLLYYYPSGTKVNKYQRISSGLVDIISIIEKTNDIVESYYFFDKQITELIGLKNHELNELIFKSIVQYTNDGKLMYLGVQRTNKSTTHPYDRMSYEDSKSYFKNTLAGSVTEFTNSAFTNTILYNLFTGLENKNIKYE